MNTLGKWLLSLFIAFTFTFWLPWLSGMVYRAVFGENKFNQLNASLTATIHDYYFYMFFISAAILTVIVARILEEKGVFVYYLKLLGIVGFVLTLYLLIAGFSH